MGSRVIVLVDGDNISASWSAEILQIGKEHGNTDVVRVYVDAHRPTDWHSVDGYRLVHAGTGKNASDLLLSIDAIEFALSSSFDVFVISSSDGDFLHLVQRLREYGSTVVGVGEAKAPNSFRAACSSFVEIGRSLAPRPTARSGSGASELDQKIRAVIAQHSKNGSGMPISQLGPKMHARHGIRISTYPERTWRGYLQARPELFDLDRRGPDAKVRFKPQGFR